MQNGSESSNKSQRHARSLRIISCESSVVNVLLSCYIVSHLEEFGSTVQAPQSRRIFNEG